MDPALTTPLLGTEHPRRAPKPRVPCTWVLLPVIMLVVVACCCCGLMLQAAGPRAHELDKGVLQQLRESNLLGDTDLAPFLAALQLDHTRVRSQPQVVKVVNGTLSKVLPTLSYCSGLVVMVVGNEKPQRRLPAQPFLTVSPSGLMESFAHAINHGVAGIEAALGRQLFPLHVTFTDRLRSLDGSSATVFVGYESLVQEPAPCSAGWHTRTRVVYEVATGTLLVDDVFVGPMQRASKVQAMLMSIATAVLQKVARAVQLATASGAAPALALVSSAGAAGLAAAFASTVPMWYCFACPIVLGLLAPLLINAGLGEAADLTCKALQLSDTECFDLFLGALGVGVLLAVLSAFPIFKVCKLYECSHPGAR